MKTEKEKMLAGELYTCNDPQLITDQRYAKDLVYDYNMLRVSQKEESQKILKKLLGKIGDNIYIHQPFYCDYGYNISIGDNFMSNMNCVMLDVCPITIGNNVLLGPNVNIFTATHPLDVKTRISWIEYGKPITIEDNVWVGGNSTILPGITIGKNSVIGAGSVVTKDVPPNVVAAGNPCRVMKKL